MGRDWLNCVFICVEMLTCRGECNDVDEMTKEVVREFVMDKFMWKLKIPTFKREVEQQSAAMTKQPVMCSA